MPRGWGSKYDYSSKPRKRMTAYNYFVQENYRYYRRVIRDRNPHAVIREVARRWARLPDYTKGKYVEMSKRDIIRAKDERERYLEMVADGTIIPSPPRPRITMQKGFPRPPLNAFLQYANAVRKDVAKKKPELDSREIMQVIGKQWTNMGPHGQRPFIEKLKRDQKRYKTAKQLFKEQYKVRRRRQRYLEGRQRLHRLFHAKNLDVIVEPVELLIEPAPVPNIDEPDVIGE